MSRSVREVLNYILDETAYLEEAVQATDLESFLRSETLRRAFVRSLEIIGEAAKRVPEEVRIRSLLSHKLSRDLQ